jgi:hypothetical protein
MGTRLRSGELRRGRPVFVLGSYAAAGPSSLWGATPRQTRLSILPEDGRYGLLRRSYSSVGGRAFSYAEATEDRSPRQTQRR